MKRGGPKINKEDIENSSFVYTVMLPGGGNIYFADRDNARKTAKEFKLKMYKLIPDINFE